MKLPSPNKLYGEKFRAELQAAAEEAIAKEKQLGEMRIALRDIISLWDNKDKSQWTIDDVMIVQRAREAAR